MSLPYCENDHLIHIDPPYLYIYADLSNFVLKNHPLQPTIASKSVVPNHRLYLLISIIHSSCWRRLVTFSRSLTPLHEKGILELKGLCHKMRYYKKKVDEIGLCSIEMFFIIRNTDADAFFKIILYHNIQQKLNILQSFFIFDFKICNYCEVSLHVRRI